MYILLTAGSCKCTFLQEKLAEQWPFWLGWPSDPILSYTSAPTPLCGSQHQVHSSAWKGQTTMEVRVCILPTPAQWIPYCDVKVPFAFCLLSPFVLLWVSWLQGRSGACHRESFWVGVKQKQVLPSVWSAYLESSFKGNSHVHWEQRVYVWHGFTD